MNRGLLLDTNVVRELFKGPRADGAVLAWAAQVDERALYLSVISLGEIEKGIALAEARGRDMRRQRVFLDDALPLRFGERLLAFDVAASRVWGAVVPAGRQSRSRAVVGD